MTLTTWVALVTKMKEDKAQSLTTTTVIEEDDWIEFITRSRDEATEKMGNAKIRCWNKE